MTVVRKQNRKALDIYKTFPIMYINSNTSDVREEGLSPFLVRNVLFSMYDYLGLRVLRDERDEIIRILLESGRLSGKEYQIVSQKKGYCFLSEKLDKYLRTHYNLCLKYSKYYFYKTVLIMHNYFNIFENSTEKEQKRWVNTLLNIYGNTFFSVFYSMVLNDFEKKEKRVLEFNIPQVLMSNISDNKKEDFELFHVFNYFFSKPNNQLSYEDFKVKKEKMSVDWSSLFNDSIVTKSTVLNLTKTISDEKCEIEQNFLDSSIPSLILTRFDSVVHRFSCDLYSNFLIELSYCLMQSFSESDKCKTLNYQNSLTEEIKKLKTLNRSLTKQLKESEKQVFEVPSVIALEKSEELLSLQKQLDSKLSLITEQEELNQKNIRKLQWQESRISELEYLLKYYSSVESDLLTLQNENNSLKAQIDLLSDIEESEGEDKFEEKLNAIKDVPLFFLGGISDMMERFVKIFPNSEYVNISDDNSNFIVPPKYQYAVVYTRVLKHSHSRRLESFLPKDQIIYVNVLNTRLVVSKIYDRINGHIK